MRTLPAVFVVSISAICSGATAQDVGRNRPAVTPTAPAVAVDRTADQKEIQALLAAFKKAFDAGDAAAVATTYTETAVVVDEDGGRVQGRAGIRDQYRKFFENRRGSKIVLDVKSLQFLGPETAIEEGRATITPPANAAAETTRFTTVYVKENGSWRQAAVRDEPADDLSPHDRLKQLEWLVGDWINESEDAMVIAKCAWAKEGNFLDREFTVKTQGRPVLTGTQRIGWDPVKQQFKTWIFESDGGHGEGYFTQNGSQWIVKIEGIGPNGKQATATNIITRLGKDRMGWQSVDRTLGGVALPGIDEFVVVRKPPEIGK